MVSREARSTPYPAPAHLIVVPELPEVETYRTLAAAAVGRKVVRVDVADPLCLGAGTTAGLLTERLVGAELTGARRRGKLLLIDGRSGSDEPTLGVRFGMTGLLMLDGAGAVDRLLYTAPEPSPRWVRFRLETTGGGGLALQDPRRFGRIILDPDEEALGPDALTVEASQLRVALAARRGGGPALKARLLDQSRLAGLGNLAVDEILWRVGLSPLRPCAGLGAREQARLHRGIRSTLRLLIRRGGSHLGDLMPERRPAGRCPRDHAALARGRIGGRSTWWCPLHQV